MFSSIILIMGIIEFNGVLSSCATEEKKTIGFARVLAVSDSFLLALGRLLGGCKIFVIRLS